MRNAPTVSPTVAKPSERSNQPMPSDAAALTVKLKMDFFGQTLAKSA